MTYGCSLWQCLQICMCYEMSTLECQRTVTCATRLHAYCKDKSCGHCWSLLVTAGQAGVDMIMHYVRCCLTSIINPQDLNSGVFRCWQDIDYYMKTRLAVRYILKTKGSGRAGRASSSLSSSSLSTFLLLLLINDCVSRPCWVCLLPNWFPTTGPVLSIPWDETHQTQV